MSSFPDLPEHIDPPEFYTDLRVGVTSFVDLSAEQAARLGSVFDAFPQLRPTHVGGDPARTAVAGSLEKLIVNHGLPISWLTEQRDSSGTSGYGEIELRQGRGRWGSVYPPDENPYRLWGHDVLQSWSRRTVERAGGFAAVETFFEDLVVTFDAAYGFVSAGGGRPAAGNSIPGIFWLNYFGPAFLVHTPRLAEISGARILRNGGVVIGTTRSPWQGEPALSAAGRAIAEILPVRGTTDRDTFLTVPSVQEHLALTPGTMVMPWEIVEQRKAAEMSAKAHARALATVSALVAERPEPVLAADSEEWSAALDLAQWESFGALLRRTLAGELLSPLGKAFFAIAPLAPVEDEFHVVFRSDLGVVRIGWHLDDEGAMDVFVTGPPVVTAICDSWYDTTVGDQ